MMENGMGCMFSIFVFKEDEMNSEDDFQYFDKVPCDE